jgi:hypothetical protein
MLERKIDRRLKCGHPADPARQLYHDEPIRRDGAIVGRINACGCYGLAGGWTTAKNTRFRGSPDPVAIGVRPETKPPGDRATSDRWEFMIRLAVVRL